MMLLAGGGASDFSFQWPNRGFEVCAEPPDTDKATTANTTTLSTRKFFRISRSSARCGRRAVVSAIPPPAPRAAIPAVSPSFADNLITRVPHQHYRAHRSGAGRLDRAGGRHAHGGSRLGRRFRSEERRVG